MRRWLFLNWQVMKELLGFVISLKYIYIYIFYVISQEAE